MQKTFLKEKDALKDLKTQHEGRELFGKVERKCQVYFCGLRGEPQIQVCLNVKMGHQVE